MAERCCARPSCNEKGVHLCSACGEEIYCSKICQKEHWPIHREACQSALRPVASVSTTQSFDVLSIKQLKNVMKAKAGQYKPEKRAKILQQLENIVEKPALVKYVSDHIKISEVDSLLIVPESSSKAQQEILKNAKPKKVPVPKENVPTAANGLPANTPMPSPEQMSQQASMMRKNPELVRRSNPALAQFSDAQIREYADQIEQAAKDPSLLRAMHLMSTAPPESRARLQLLQEGVSGARPMDAQWVSAACQLIYSLGSASGNGGNAESELLEALLGGRLGAEAGAGAGAEAVAWVRWLLRLLAELSPLWLGRLVGGGVALVNTLKPLPALFARVDQMSLGTARYLLSGLVLFLAFVVARLVYRSTYAVFSFLFSLFSFLFKATPLSGASSPVASSVASSVVNEVANSAEGVAQTVAAVAGQLEEF